MTISWKTESFEGLSAGVSLFSGIDPSTKLLCRVPLLLVAFVGTCLLERGNGAGIVAVVFDITGAGAEIGTGAATGAVAVVAEAGRSMCFDF